MFTGIIQALGVIQSKQVFEKGARLEFKTHDLDLSNVAIGDSIAVNGVCLTAIEITSHSFKADLSQETLDCTVFDKLNENSAVNLEKALRINQGIDGHLVSGHVDGVAIVVDKFNEGESTRFKIKAPKNLVKYIAKKGSACINGVSLTVNSIENDVFDLNIVPHTLTKTTLGQLNIGDGVNLEVDIIARHLEQLIANK
ncbi:riboflavin synthase [Candidatus Thioglobus sp.]|uniref:riboflavin synthase n=1 Tax=Candidatus Thioglobus sp. TaxID=2026721 RepID=UPI003D0F29BC